MNFNFTNKTIQIEEGMAFYLSSDGFIDQLGGKRGFPLGKRRFIQLIQEQSDKPFAEQQQFLLEAITSYQGEHERLDDITVIGFGKLHELNTFERPT